MLPSLLFAILLHEGGHALAILLFGGRIYRLTPHFFGLTITTEALSHNTDRIAVFLAGPFFGILGYLLAAPFESLSPFAEISLGLSLFNLLPIETLDGGEALRILLCELFPPRIGKRIAGGISLFFLLPLWMSAVYLLLFMNGNPSLFFLSLWLFFRKISQKHHPSPS